MFVSSGDFAKVITRNFDCHGSGSCSSHRRINLPVPRSDETPAAVASTCAEKAISNLASLPGAAICSIISSSRVAAFLRELIANINSAGAPSGVSKSITLIDYVAT
ncbi:unannotated protein [freshwater metagenome]|uniref:Unannotated protein n=1 Tax=freshwater metagenome TaxID=449393 RepID=A0A6J6CZ75_9ZZZZ